MKEKIQEFWGDLYKQWYELNDNALTPDRLNEQLDAVEKYFKMRGQLAVREMPYNNLKEKKSWKSDAVVVHILRFLKERGRM